MVVTINMDIAMGTAMGIRMGWEVITITMIRRTSFRAIVMTLA